MANPNTQPVPLPVNPVEPMPLTPGSWTPEQLANAHASENAWRREKMGQFALMFAVGFGLGWFFFRNREQKTKIMAGIGFGLGLPVLLYMTIGRMGFDSAPPKPSIQNFFATFGFGNFESSTTGLHQGIKGPQV